MVSSNNKKTLNKGDVALINAQLALSESYTQPEKKVSLPKRQKNTFALTIFCEKAAKAQL